MTALRHTKGIRCIHIHGWMTEQVVSAHCRGTVWDDSATEGSRRRGLRARERRRAGPRGTGRDGERRDTDLAPPRRVRPGHGLRRSHARAIRQLTRPAAPGPSGRGAACRLGAPPMKRTTRRRQAPARPPGRARPGRPRSAALLRRGSAARGDRRQPRDRIRP